MDFRIDNILWKNVTSYSRDDKERVPKSWETTIGDVRIYITCDHVHYRPNWIFHCYALGFDTKSMIASCKEEAARIALSICKNKVLSIYKSFFNA